jgi:hypothetical protein
MLNCSNIYKIHTHRVYLYSTSMYSVPDNHTSSFHIPPSRSAPRQVYILVEKGQRANLLYSVIIVLCEGNSGQDSSLLGKVGGSLLPHQV